MDELEAELRYRAKALLRKRARALRSTIPPDALAVRSAAIVRTLATLEDVIRGRTVALFYPIEDRNEVDLRALDADLRARGTRVAYPSIDPDTRVMTFRIPETLADLDERGLGFREPRPDAPEALDLDAIVVPALQVDAAGHRIGYGAGYYDRTLPRLAPPARTICVAFDFQLIAEVPVTEGDVAVDVVVTDQRVIEVRPRG